MLDLLIAAALAQGAAPAAGPRDPCKAAGRAEQALAGCPTRRLIARNAQGLGFVDPTSAGRDGDRVVVMTRTLLNAAGARTYERGADEEPRPATPGSPFSQMLDEFCPRRTGRP